MDPDKPDNSWVQFLRSNDQQGNLATRVRCSVCTEEVYFDLEAFKSHVAENAITHPTLAGAADIEDAFKMMTIQSTRSQNHRHTREVGTTRRQGNSPAIIQRKSKSGSVDNTNANSKSQPGTKSGSADMPSPRGRKQRRAAAASSTAKQKAASPPTAQVRSQGRRGANTKDFERTQNMKNPPGRTLWTPEGETPARNPRASNPQSGQGSQGKQPKSQPRQAKRSSQQGEVKDEPATMFREPEVTKITEDQLFREVKDIYTGLTLVESKSIEVYKAQNDAKANLKPEQWQALTALHRTILHEHHDFFLASQHPSANASLRRLGTKYKMPERMWRHGIHSFLELLRSKLPDSMEYMLTYIYLAYGMVALLYETVPAYADNWVECLGDLARYRMAIEDEDIRDRETWAAVATQWYLRGVSRMPRTGRLYHHLAILARPRAVEQLFYFNKCLCVEGVYINARESILTLFNPILTTKYLASADVDVLFVGIHGLLFNNNLDGEFDQLIPTFLGQLDRSIDKKGKHWVQTGYFMGVSLGCTLLDYSNQSSALLKLIAASTTGSSGDAMQQDQMLPLQEESRKLGKALHFATQTYSVVIRRQWDQATLPFLHTMMVFVYYMTFFGVAMGHIEQEIPWKLMALMLNEFIQSCADNDYEPQMHSNDFPGPHKDEALRPLPEDYAMRGLIWADKIFPENWFSSESQDEEEKYFNLPSMAMVRHERMLWIGRRIAESGQWLTWDQASGQFAVTAKYNVDVGDFPLSKATMQVASDTVVTMTDADDATL